MEQESQRSPSSRTARRLQSGWIEKWTRQGLNEGLRLARTCPPGTEHLRMDWAGATEESEMIMLTASSAG